jgi:hypothetical protein
MNNLGINNLGWKSNGKTIKQLGLAFYCLGTFYLLSHILGQATPITIFELYLFVGFNLLFGMVWGWWYITSANQIIKYFHTTPYTTMSIVQNVLQQKSFPYENKEKDGLVIPIENGEIVIKASTGYRGIGAVIAISPTTPENMPLIESLCAKLDEAFTPRGLKN